MDYSKPFDAELFPEGCERCSLTKFLAWMSFLGVIFLWGLYAAIRVLGFGLGETGMDDYFGFGLWITFDLAVIALGAGAFFTGALRYILNIDELKNIVNLAAVIGFLCYTGAMLILVLDIGQPIRCWFGYWYPNVHSMLTEVIFCITCYCVVLILEYVPLVLENRKLMQIRFVRILAHNFHVYMPIFAGIGAFLSTFHQGSLGGTPEGLILGSFSGVNINNKGLVHKILPWLWPFCLLLLFGFVFLFILWNKPGTDGHKLACLFFRKKFKSLFLFLLVIFSGVVCNIHGHGVILLLRDAVYIDGLLYIDFHVLHEIRELLNIKRICHTLPPSLSEADLIRIGLKV